MELVPRDARRLRHRGRCAAPAATACSTASRPTERRPGRRLDSPPPLPQTRRTGGRGGMSRIERRFAALAAADAKAFVAFVMAGDPDYDTALAVLRGLPAAGVDVIELGMPFTDPMADGPAIQRAGQRALAGGHTHGPHAGHGPRLPRGRRRDAGRPHGLLQPDLFPRRRPLPRRREGGGRRRPHRRRPPARGGRGALPPRPRRRPRLHPPGDAHHRRPPAAAGADQHLGLRLLRLDHRHHRRRRRQRRHRRPPRSPASSARRPSRSASASASAPPPPAPRSPASPTAPSSAPPSSTASAPASPPTRCSPSSPPSPKPPTAPEASLPQAARHWRTSSPCGLRGHLPRSHATRLPRAAPAPVQRRQRVLVQLRRRLASPMSMQRRAAGGAAKARPRRTAEPRSGWSRSRWR